MVAHQYCSQGHGEKSKDVTEPTARIAPLVALALRKHTRYWHRHVEIGGSLGAASWTWIVTRSLGPTGTIFLLALDVRRRHRYAMSVIQAQLSRVFRTGHTVSVLDGIAVVAAILSLLTLTLLVPAGLHLPW